MVDMVKRYVCDVCKKQLCVDVEVDAFEWEKTDIGDLCPACARAWKDYKESFLIKMRKESGESLI